MKSLFFVTMITLIAAACNNSSTDSVEKADSTNKARIDSSADTSNKTAIAADKETSEFLVKATDGGIMEVSLGNIAKTKGRNASVKKFGEMMIEDHEKANAKIKDLAAARHVEVPARVSDDKADMIKKLNTKDGKDFDKAYIDMMVDDHNEDIDMFDKASKDLKDADLKAFATNTLPTLRAHLDSAKAVQESLKKR